MKAEPPKRKRRWYQFSLRTLMIVVTLLAGACAYLGSQAKIVRDRRAMRYEINRTGDGAYVQEPLDPDTPCKVPWIRSLLGDEAAEIIALPMKASKEFRDHVRATFPEACLFAMELDEGEKPIGRYHPVFWPEDRPQQ